MTIRQSSVGRDILIGMGAGLLAVLPSVRSILFFLGSSRRSKGQREMAVREGSPHDVAANKIAKRLGGEEPSDRAKRLGRVAFATAYRVGWGLSMR